MLRSALSVGIVALALLGVSAASVADKQAALTDVVADDAHPDRRTFGVSAPFTKCADEWGTCTCNGDIRYGVDDHWIYRKTDGEEEISCTNDVFTDPIFGTVKRCECQPEIWKECAGENGVCQCEGDVRFGTVTSWGNQRWSYRYSADNITCDVNHFSDPAAGLEKKCYCKPAGWTQCAGEGGACQCSSTIRFGANGAYRYLKADGESTRCHQSEFDNMDPAVGTPKQCDCYDGILDLNRRYRWCANEGGSCLCPWGATVRFGAGLSYSDRVISATIASCKSQFWGWFRPDGPWPDCQCITWEGDLNES